MDRKILVLVALAVFVQFLFEGATCDKPKKKKDPRDYTDADIEKLYEEWEKDEEPLPDDELPEWKRPPKPVDWSKMDMSNPEAMVAATKQGKPVMMFVTVSDNPNKKEMEDITGLWQTSLYNNHMDIQRFEIENNRVIFMFKEGQQAFEAVKWLVLQDRCEEVVLESKTYKGKAAKPEKDTKNGKAEL